MRDRDKTKEQLIKELEEMRRATTGLKALKGKYKQVELEKEHIRLRTIFESVSEGVAVTDMELRITDINEAGIHMFGYNCKEEIIGRSGLEFISGKDHARAMVDMRSTLEKGHSGTLEYTFLDKKRREFLAEYSVIVIKDESGSPAGFVATMKDITERKKAEEALRESQKKFQALVETTSDFIWEINLNGFYTYCSPQMEKLWGLKPQNMLGKTPFDLLLTKQDKGQAMKTFSAILESAAPFTNLEARSFDGAGRIRFLEISGVPFFDTKGKLDGYRGITRDITERKKAEEALHIQSEILRNMKEGILLTNSSDRKMLYTNPRFEEMFGYGPGELIGKDVAILNAPGERTPKEVAAEIIKYLDENGAWYGEVHSIKKDGTHFWSRASVSEFEHPVYGRVDINVLEDITERKKVESDLQQSEEKYRSLVNNISLGIFRSTPEPKGRFLEVNPAMEQITGYSKEELLHMDVRDLYGYPEERKVLLEEVASATDMITREVRLMRKDGIEIIVNDTKVAIGDNSGQILYFDGIIEDITERKKAEDTLKESERKYRTLVENIPEKIFLKDRNSVYVSCNKNYAQDLKIKPEEIAGRTDYEFYPKDLAEKYIADDKRIIESGQTESIEERYIQDGQERVVQTFKTPVDDEEGNVVGILGIFHDITERKQLEAERQRVEKLESIGTLAGGIAHDFNNLLTGIMGNISLAKRYVEPRGKAVERLEEAEKASIRAKDLTQQLLTFSRGGAPVKKLISLSELIKESATFILHGSRVKPAFSLPEDLWTVEADEGQIGQVIHNLVKNAGEAMPEGGVVEINAKNITVKDKSALSLSKGRYVEITITDFGIGIKKENIDKIFNHYFTTKQKGSGLGLATAYSIIRNHGGHITVDSTLGVGTIVYVYLPASKKQVSKKKEAEEVQPTFIDQGRILVMDDEPTIRLLLGRILEDAGYQVELTSDGSEAIERYTKAKESGEPFDAVILDLTVPGGMGGKEAITKLLDMDPEVKAIVSSGYATDPIMSEYKKYGFSTVVPKPYSVSQLEKTLQSLLKKK